jgi:hypothetical protein
MLTGAHKTQRMTSALTFLERHQKDADETWVSFVNDEIKEQSKQWIHTHSPNSPKSLSKRCLPEI